jgi:hypothetical protein
MDNHYFLQDAHGAYYAINGPTTIGRDISCQIRLSDPEVSRNHALLWIDHRNLYIRDENTGNGTYLNDHRIPPNQPIALAPGSQLRFGSVSFIVVNLEPAAAQTPPTVSAQPPVVPNRVNKSSQLPIYLTLLIGGLCLGALALVVGYFFLKSRENTPEIQATAQDSSGVTIIATSAPQPLLAPKDFADANGYLALAIAKLNTAQLVFIRHADGTNPDSKVLDDDLREVAAQSMNVALLAERQARTAAAQGRKSAAQYYSIARVGYALALEAQNLRRGLQKQTITPAQAFKTIAKYGVRLWNPMVSAPGVRGNPFLPYASEASSQSSVHFLKDEAVTQLKQQAGSNGQIQTWMASSVEMEIIQLDLPALGKPITQPPDPAVLQKLTQASAQADMDSAQQAAAAKLAMLLPYSEQLSISDIPFSMQVEILSGVAIADAGQIEAGNVPTYPKGQSSTLAKQASAGNEFIENIYTLAGDAPPVQTESTPLKETQPVVTLQITGAKETSRTPMAKTFGDLIQFDVQISWQSTLTAPMLDIGCLGGSSVRVTGQSGSIKVSAAAYANPQTQQATISCRASRPADFVQSLSETSIQVSVNSSANVEQAPPPPTVTETLPPTVTQTLEPSATPTPNKTEQALSTEIAAEKTAEFQGTITAIAAQTEQANQASIFTMKGTFGLSHPDDPCNLGPHSSGTLQITVNFGAGAANGTLTGGGSSTRTGLVCGAIKFDVTCNSSYTGSFSGGVDKTSGALSMSGNVTGNQTCTFSNCSQDGVEFTCSPGASSISDPLTITGTVIQSSGTGNGAMTTCAGCTGDWSAGK